MSKEYLPGYVNAPLWSFTFNSFDKLPNCQNLSKIKINYKKTGHFQCRPRSLWSNFLFIGQAGDLKPNTEKQMSEEVFCCRFN